MDKDMERTPETAAETAAARTVSAEASSKAALAASGDASPETEEAIYTASQWKLMWRRFRKHKLAVVSGVIILLLYLTAIFAPFIAPYDPYEYDVNYPFQQPQRIRFIDPERGFNPFRPFAFGMSSSRDPETLRKIYVEDRSKVLPLRFFVRGYEYKLFGLIPADLHLFGTTGDGRIMIFGADELGRDVFSKIVYGTQISMSIGLIGIAFSFVLGLLIGGVSGYYGGRVDNVIQRFIEIIRSFPTIPLWMALTASLPRHWSPVRVYFMITIILSLIGWTGLARVVRGKFLSLREEDFTKAAKLLGAGEFYIIRKHFIPSFTSHIIAAVTLAIPGMILGETALSFLKIGLRPPVVSWGVLLQEAQNVRTVANHPWLFMPALLVVITVLAFNFLGDGLRDAADPYGRRG